MIVAFNVLSRVLSLVFFLRPDSPGPLRGARVTVPLGVGILVLARFVEDDPWWGQDSLMT